ncbi:MAG: 3-methyl-2-oxobutanoate hydroxymethyltransferase [Coriobacteriales bacterium]|jgi:3-methyl-2-oxobutanoate hydroxymethyltransferase|nr:3-methyl-2-oxobutanoate hydroxymethyltransferase [Coriobacteriales bacterium]
MSEQRNPMFSPIPKMSLASKSRKSIHYLQKLKDEKTPIVQHCPSMLGPIFTMAADMAGVDICRLPPSGGTGPEEGVKRSMEYIGSYRAMAPRIHINYVMETIAHASKHDALKNGAMAHQAGADSMLPMGVNNKILKYMADNYVIVYGHVGAISGWQTMGAFGGYKRLGKTAEEALEVYKMAYEYQENGMKAMSIELVPIEVANTVAKKMRVPVIGIAAGGACDGSEMVDADLFGLMASPATHAKTYAYFMEFATQAYGAWANDVRTSAYPEDKHGVHMDEQELEKFLDLVDKF